MVGMLNQDFKEKMVCYTSEVELIVTSYRLPPTKTIRYCYQRFAYFSVMN